MTEEAEILPPEEDTTEMVIQEETPLPAVHNDTGDEIMAIIKAVATNPDVDVKKMKAIMDMKIQHEDREAEKAFARDFVTMKPHLPKVIRNKRNDQTKSKYADLDTILDTVEPILAEYGFSVAFDVNQTKEDVTAICELMHKAGHIKETSFTVPLDDKGIAGKVNKTAVHATASASSYAERYALCKRLAIRTGDDNDGNAAQKKAEELVSEIQAEIITDALMNCNDTTKDWFTETFEAANQVKKVNFEKLVARLKQAAEKGETITEEKADE